MKNVLVVDDNAVVRRHLRGLLERDACLVVEATDGLEALRELLQAPFDLVFLDLQMPNLDGLGVLREMQRLSLKVPVVLITSSESSQEIVAAFKLGAKDYALKPFREAQLRHVLQQFAGLDPTTLQRTGLRVALLDPDEGLAMMVRGLCSASDSVEQAETVQGVPVVLSTSKHQLVLVGGWEPPGDARAEEAEALGDLVTQRDADAVLVRVLEDKAELPDVTVFHAGVSRDKEAELQALIAVLRSGGAVFSGRAVRALRFPGPASLAHLYWWSLTRSLRTVLGKMLALGASSVVIDLALAPNDATARQELENTITAEAEEKMIRVRFASVSEAATKHGAAVARVATPPPSTAFAPPPPSTPSAVMTAFGPPVNMANPVTLPPLAQPAPLPPPPVASRVDTPLAALLKPTRVSENQPTTVARRDGPPIIPGYEVGELLGEGGMSRVFRATQKSLRRQVCVKVLRPELLLEPGLADRFRDEGIALATLRHPNIVSVLDVGTSDDGQLFMLMEAAEGGDLRQLLKRVDRLPVAQAVAFGVQLLSGLAEAHGHGIIHRDIKPSNVLVATLKDGTKLVKLVDFGIAKLIEGNRGRGQTRLGAVVGTPGYMAPEQLLGMEITPTADLYALGVILFEMLTGRRAFVARDEFELAQLTMLTPAPHLREVLDADVPAGLDEVVNALLAKNPKDRPSSAAEVRERLLSLPALKAA